MYKKITNFIFELANLKKFKHCGIKFAGVKDPDSLAEHALRASQIAYILADLEKANPEKCALMAMIHDNGEIRVGDQHKISRRYFDVKPFEKKAFMDQTKNLPTKTGSVFANLYEEFDAQKTKESHIARDSDMLETAFQAKEYLDNGYEKAQLWIDNVKKHLRTESAKKILKEMEKTHFTDWFTSR
ncbi:MAG: HD domain-containing protein [Candidatus Gracilibacteria bacterium]|jgi:putative hydrolase of HD superfamily